MIPTVIRPTLLRTRLQNLNARNFAYLGGYGSNQAAVGSMFPNKINHASSSLGVTDDASVQGLSFFPETSKEAHHQRKSESDSSTVESEASLSSYIPSSSMLLLNTLYDGKQFEVSSLADHSSTSQNGVEYSRFYDEECLILQQLQPFERLINSSYADKLVPKDTTSDIESISIRGSDSLQLATLPSITLNLKCSDNVTPSESWLDLILKFKCAICQDVLACPCATNCSHSYCGACLMDYMETANNTIEAKTCCLCKTEISTVVYERGYDSIICEHVYKHSQTAEGRENIPDWEERRSDYFQREREVAESRSKAGSVGANNGVSATRRVGGGGGVLPAAAPEGGDWLDLYGDLIFYSGAFLVVAYTALSTIYKPRRNNG